MPFHKRAVSKKKNPGQMVAATTATGPERQARHDFSVTPGCCLLLLLMGASWVQAASAEGIVAMELGRNGGSVSSLAGREAEADNAARAEPLLPERVAVEGQGDGFWEMGLEGEEIPAEEESCRVRLKSVGIVAGKPFGLPPSFQRRGLAYRVPEVPAEKKVLPAGGTE
ncbi:hypothetical protein ACUUL3_13975 [Thiovibrio sp. JS02]